MQGQALVVPSMWKGDKYQVEDIIISQGLEYGPSKQFPHKVFQGMQVNDSSQYFKTIQKEIPIFLWCSCIVCSF
jgi:hypothetical protein